mmetsp:Transcript_117903/g.345438  ORF Transcript_117903/g.345438 Transcript_117903/m.345438 type:complete len:228 (+) Transcript_117903:183-866(+)
MKPPKSIIRPSPWPLCSQSAPHSISCALDTEMPALQASSCAVSPASVTFSSGGTSMTARKPHIRCQSCSCFLSSHETIDVKTFTSSCPPGSASHILERLSTSCMQMSTFRKLLNKAARSRDLTTPLEASTCLEKPASIAARWLLPSSASRARCPNCRKPALPSGWLGSSAALLKKPAYIRALTARPGSITLPPWQGTLNVLKDTSRSRRHSAGSSGRKGSSSEGTGS